MTFRFRHFWIVVAMLAVVSGGLLLGPEFRHRHADGDAPHTHHHGHSHTHGHSHSHGHAHPSGHASSHDHGGVSAKDSWHTHISFFGWQLTLFDGDESSATATGPGVAKSSNGLETHLPCVVRALFEVQLLPGPARIAGLVLSPSGRWHNSAELPGGRDADAPQLPPPKAPQV